MNKVLFLTCMLFCVTHVFGQPQMVRTNTYWRKKQNENIAILANKDFVLYYQANSDLVLYYGNIPIWKAETNGQPSDQLAFQNDGDLVITNEGRQVWSSGSRNEGGSVLTLFDDGRLIIYTSRGKAIWRAYPNIPLTRSALPSAPPSAPPPAPAPAPPPPPSAPIATSPVNASNNSGSPLPGGSWQQMPGGAKDIAVNVNGDIWVIGADAQTGGYGIYHWISSNWVKVDGAAVRIAVDNTARPWVVNSFGEIFCRSGNGWQKMPGSATDIGAGQDGSIWVIGTDSQAGGYGIYRWNGSDWSKVDGGAVRIAVDKDGIPWVVNSFGEIYCRRGNGWQKMPGAAKDIGVCWRSPWIIGTDAQPGGYGIYMWGGQDWFKAPGAGVAISVGMNGTPCLVNADGNIYFWATENNQGTLTNDQICCNQKLEINSKLTSRNGMYYLIFQGDGNLVLYTSNNQPIWASNTNGRDLTTCIMQGDGNLVIYNSANQPVWASNSSGTNARLVMQDDGNLVIYNSANQPIWASYTKR